MLKQTAYILIAMIAVMDFIVWQNIGKTNTALEVLFFDVGQGDATLVRFPGGEDMLIDGGPPNGKVLGELSENLPLGDRYLDLVVLTHPDLDHFGGLIEVLENYDIGAVIGNGAKGTASNFETLAQKIQEKEKRYVSLGEGDQILIGNSKINIIAPSVEEKRGPKSNDASLVFNLESGGARILFTGDIGSAIEKRLVEEQKSQDVEVLKVAHHGSKFSSSASFLESVRPEISVISSGKNSYGHPTKEVIRRLKDVNSKILRTDQSGTIMVKIDNNHLKIFTEK